MADLELDSAGNVAGSPAAIELAAGGEKAAPAPAAPAATGAPSSEATPPAGPAAGAPAAAAAAPAPAVDNPPDFLEGTGLTSQNIPPALQPAYKKMQAGLTKRFQEVAQRERAVTGAFEGNDPQEVFNIARQWDGLRTDPFIAARIEWAAREGSTDAEWAAEVARLTGPTGAPGAPAAPPAGTPPATPAAPLTAADAQALWERNRAAERLRDEAQKAEADFITRVGGADVYRAGIPKMRPHLAKMRGSQLSPQERIESAWRLAGLTIPAPAGTARPRAPGVQVGPDRGRGGQGPAQVARPKGTSPEAIREFAAAQADALHGDPWKPAQP